MVLVNNPGLRWSTPGAHPSVSDRLIRKILVTPSHFCSGCEECIDTSWHSPNQVERFYTAMATHPTWLLANQWLLLSPVSQTAYISGLMRFGTRSTCWVLLCSYSSLSTVYLHQLTYFIVNVQTTHWLWLKWNIYGSFDNSI